MPSIAVTAFFLDAQIWGTFVLGPYAILASAVFTPGARAGETFTPGSTRGKVFTPGSQAAGLPEETTEGKC